MGVRLLDITGFRLKRPPRASIPVVFIAALVFSLLWLGQSTPKPVLADNIPEPPQNVVYILPFESSAQSKYGPGPAAPGSLTLPLAGTSWNVSGSAGDIITIGGDISFFGFTIPAPSVSFGGRIGGQFSGNVSVFATLEGFNKSTVDVDYPIQVNLSFPRKDQFRHGETVTINSNFTVLPGASLNTTPIEEGEMELGMELGMSAGVSFELCLFVCTGDLSIFPGPAVLMAKLLQLVDPNLHSIKTEMGLGKIKVAAPEIGLPETEIDLGTIGVSLDIDAMSQGALKVDVKGNFLKTKIPQRLQIPRSVEDPFGVAGHVGLPRVETSSRLAPDRRTLFASGSSDFASFRADPLASIALPISFPLATDEPTCIINFMAGRAQSPQQQQTGTQMAGSLVSGPVYDSLDDIFAQSLALQLAADVTSLAIQAYTNPSEIEVDQAARVAASSLIIFDQLQPGVIPQPVVQLASDIVNLPDVPLAIHGINFAINLGRDLIGGQVPALDVALDITGRTLTVLQPFLADPEAAETTEVALAIAGLLFDLADENFGPCRDLTLTRDLFDVIRPVIESPEEFNPSLAAVAVSDLSLLIAERIVEAVQPDPLPELTLVRSLLDVVRPYAEDPDAFEPGQAVPLLAEALILYAEDRFGQTQATVIA